MTTEQDRWLFGLISLALLIMGAVQVTSIIADDNSNQPNVEGELLRQVDSLESVVDSLDDEVSLRDEASSYADAYNTNNRISRAVVHYANKHDVPVAIAFSLVFSESRFDSMAVSSVGAVGLAQVRPSTARYLRDSISRDDLFNPDTNLDVGFMYLRRLIDRKGSMYEALRSYVAGPSRTRHNQQIGHGYANGIINRAN